MTGAVITSFMTPNNAKKPPVLDPDNGVVTYTAIDGTYLYAKAAPNKDYIYDGCTEDGTTFTATFVMPSASENTDNDENIFDNILLLLCSL